MQMVWVLISVELNSQLSLLTYHNAKCANHPSNPQEIHKSLMSHDGYLVNFTCLFANNQVVKFNLLQLILLLSFFPSLGFLKAGGSSQ